MNNPSSGVNPLVVFQRPKGRIRDIWVTKKQTSGSDHLFSSFVSQERETLERCSIPRSSLAFRDAVVFAEALKHFRDTETIDPHVEFQSRPNVLKTHKLLDDSTHDEYVLVPRQSLAKLEHLELYLKAERAKKTQQCTFMFHETKVSARFPYDFIVTAVMTMLDQGLVKVQKQLHEVLAMKVPELPRHLQRLQRKIQSSGSGDASIPGSRYVLVDRRGINI